MFILEKGVVYSGPSKFAEDLERFHDTTKKESSKHILKKKVLKKTHYLMKS